MSHKRSSSLLKLLQPALALTVIAVVVTAALAGVNTLTENIIAAREQEAADAARQQVITADRFDSRSFVYQQETVVYHVAYQNDVPVGYVFTAETSGKSAGLVVMTGIGLDGKVTGVAVPSNNETAGYVDTVVADGLLDRIVQKGDADVDATANATRTSEGIKAGVKQAQTYYDAIVKGGAST